MTIINRENCFYYYDERLWCDYSSSLKDIRKRAERHIDEFIQSNKARSLVVQAPYGSGKSTLLRYLLVYSWEKGIPAILVNLSSIVKFIASSNKEYTLGYIPEDDLPNIIEQFYNKIKAEVLNNPESIKKYTNNINISNFQEILNRSNNFVILIDEVEEALENLRKIISSQTSPFRTIMDKPLKGTSKFYPILAYGPLTMAKNLLVGPTQWRPDTVGIPPIKVDNIITMVDKAIGKDINQDYKKSISSFIWFLSRGRLGWVSKIIDSGLANELLDLLIRRDFNAASDFLKHDIVYKYFPGNLFSKDIKIVDENSLKKDLKNNEAYSFLILNAGPVSIKDVGYGIKEDTYYYSSEMLININQLLDEIDNMIKGNKNIRIDDDIRNSIIDYTETFLSAISNANNYILFSKEFLANLKEALLAYIQDMLYQNPEAEDAVNNIGFDIIYSILKNKAKKADGETFIQIKPTKILEYFPLLTTLPLIGFARAHRDKIEEQGYIKDYNSQLEIALNGIVKIMKFSSELEKDANIANNIILLPVLLSSLKYGSKRQNKRYYRE